MKTAEIINIIGRLKGIRFTDLSQSSFDLAIVLVAHEDVRKQPYEIKINPTFLAKELGMDVAARPSIDLILEPTIEEGETDKEFEKRLAEYNKLKNAAVSEMSDFLNNRSKQSRRWLTEKVKELITDTTYVRVAAEDRIVGKTGYGDDPSSLTPHKSSGLFLTRISLMDEEEVIEHKLNSNERIVDIDDELKIRKYEDEKRAMLRAKADERRANTRAKLNGSSKPAEEIPVMEDDSPFGNN